MAAVVAYRPIFTITRRIDGNRIKNQFCDAPVTCGNDYNNAIAPRLFQSEANAAKITFVGVAYYLIFCATFSEKRPAYFSCGLSNLCVWVVGRSVQWSSRTVILNWRHFVAPPCGQFYTGSALRDWCYNGTDRRDWCYNGTGLVLSGTDGIRTCSTTSTTLRAPTGLILLAATVAFSNLGLLMRLSP